MFQHTAFQNSGFQTLIGASDTTPLGTTILDGANDAVSFLEQEAEYLTTLGDSLGQAPDGGDGCVFPLVDFISTGDFSQSTSDWTISVPAGGAGGDLAVFFIVFGSGVQTLSTVNNGWTLSSSTADIGGTVSVVWKYLNGTGDTTIDVTSSGNPAGYSYQSYLIAGETTARESPEFVVNAVNGNDPPAISPSWGADKSLAIAYLKLGTPVTNVTGWSYSNGRTALAATQTNPSVSSYGTFEASSEDPPTYTLSAGSGQLAVTAAVRGACFEDPLPKCQVPDVYELGLELPDGEGFTQNGVRENDVPLDCVFPSITGSASYGSDTQALSTTHSVTMPATVGAGDLLVTFFNTTAPIASWSVTLPSGWVLGEAPRVERFESAIAFKVADGTEGGTSPTFTFGTSVNCSAITVAIAAGTYNPVINGAATVDAVTGNTVNWDPPSNTYIGGETDKYLYFAIGGAGEANSVTGITVSTYPSGYTDLQSATAAQASGGSVRSIIGVAATTGTSATFDPGTGTFSGTPGASARNAKSYSIRGFCGVTPVWTDQNPYEDYAWDDADYGTQTDVSFDDIIPDDPSSGSTVDDSEYLIDDADYGTQTDPVGDDADLAQSIWSDGNNVEDPTWTDTTDYSTQSDPLADNVDLGQSISDNGTNVEDPYFTDFTDYGTQTDPLSADFPQDFLLGLDDGTTLEDPTGADWFEYGTQTDPLAPDFPQDFPQALIDDGNTVEDATYTDWSEYGTQTDVSFDDINTTQEDFLLGIDSGNDQFDDPTQTDQSDYGTQSAPQIDDVDLAQGIWEDGNTRDDTDYADYGTQNDPLAPDFPEDFVLGVDDGTNLEDPTGADWFEYGTQSDPLAPDADLAQAIIDSGDVLEDPTFTDFTDYGTQSDPLAADVDLAQGIIDSGDTLEDPTGADWFEYGTQTDPLSPDAAEDAILGIDDGTNLEDPSGTDWFEYGTQSDILLFLQQDFNLGTGDGLDDQDWTDFRDYSFTQDGVSNMEGGTLNVFVTGVSGSGQVTHVCPSIFNNIPEPSGSYTVITTATNTYSDITTPSPNYTTITDPSGSWTDITPGSNTWTAVDDC